GLADGRRIEAARNGSDAHRLTGDVREDLNAVLPLLENLRRRARTEPGRVRVRVGSDHVAATLQFADLRRVEERGTSDTAGGDEKVATPSVAFEGIGDVL